MSKTAESKSLEDDMKDIESMFSSKPKKSKKDKKDSKEKKEKKPVDEPKETEKAEEKVVEPAQSQPELALAQEENAVDIQGDMAQELSSATKHSHTDDQPGNAGDDGNEEIEFDGEGEDIILDDEDVPSQLLRTDYTPQGPTGAQVVADIIGTQAPSTTSTEIFSINSPMIAASPFSYQELLDRVYHLIQVNNPESMEKKRHILKPPQLMRIGTKKTLWVNFNQLCTILHRPPEHLSIFMTIELGTEGSIDASQRLVIRGKFVSKNISSLLRKYIREYVTCGNCKTLDTIMNRDNSSKLYFVTCQNCNASRSVPPIRAGFHAQTRDDRRNARK